MTTKPILTREPPVAVKTLLIKLVEISGRDQPEHVLDAAVNHLGITLAIIAKSDGLSRGELKAKARKAFEDCLEMALANYAQAQMPGETGGVH